MMRGFGRRQQPEPERQPALPDLHPAQVDLLEAKENLAAAVGQVDATLHWAGNARPALRDALLDIRRALTRTATP